MRVRDDELHAAQSAPGEAAQEVGPEGFRLRGAARRLESWRQDRRKIKMP